MLMKKLDALLGRLAVNLLPPPVRYDIPSDLTSILIIRPGGIGDAILLAPAIRSLKNNCPQVRITVLAERRNAGVFSLIPEVDELLCYDSPREFWQALRDRHDIVIDTEQWHRLSALVARFVRAPVKIGFNTNERRSMFTHIVPYSHEEYEALSFSRLIGSMGIGEGELNREAPFLHIPDTALKCADNLLNSFAGKPFVIIFSGASVAERRWGAERFGLVAARLSEDGYRVVVVGGSEDMEDGDIITVATGMNLAGMTTLAETAALIALSCLLISGDSGVLHLAVGLDIPTVSLYGPGIAAKWASVGEKHVVLNRKLSCSPCTRFGTTPPCPYGVRCMVEITPDEVMEAAMFQLNKKQQIIIPKMQFK